MSVINEKTVREVALENPVATRVFEKFGIDYCCGGGRSLDEACHAANVSINSVEQALASAEQNATARQQERNWQAEPVSELIRHIRETHHRYVREEIDRLDPLFNKVCDVHGERHPELLPLRDTFQGLADELMMHMTKEEMILFPYIARLEEAQLSRQPASRPPFGTVKNPIMMMQHEHDSAGEALRQLRATSDSYTPPADGCASFRALYKALADFEADLHQHIHLENNILFPRAVEMEQAA